jgi:hypothetical protein
MINFNDILSEIIVKIYYCEVLVKTSKEENKVYIYNEIRGLKDVVVVKVITNNYLDNQSTDKIEYTLLQIKYLVRSTPEDDIISIKKNALITDKIPGLLQFIPRLKTIKLIGEY